MSPHIKTSNAKSKRIKKKPYVDKVRIPSRTEGHFIQPLK